MSAWATGALKDVTEHVSRWNPRATPDATFTYVDLSAIDSLSKSIVSADEILGREAPSRARQLIQLGDVLISTVRPNLNAVAAVTEEHDGATASTGFTVLRPSALVDHTFLMHWVRSPWFVDDMVRKATGASYPAVSDRIVKNSSLPLPPIAEQRRIASILGETDAIRAKRRAQLAHLDELPQALFHEMFGNLVPDAVVTDLVSKQKGAIRTGPFGSQLLHEEFVGEGVAVLGLDNVVGNSFGWAKRRFITSQKYDQLRRYTVHPGDVLISIMGTVGRCVVVPDTIETAINTKHICAITLDQGVACPDYVRAAFLWHPASRRYLAHETKGAIMAGLNMGIIKKMPLPLPPLRDQEAYATKMSEIQSERDRVARALQADDELFTALQHRAFRGEL